jgi:hypothetical protein
VAALPHENDTCPYLNYQQAGIWAQVGQRGILPSYPEMILDVLEHLLVVENYLLRTTQGFHSLEADASEVHCLASQEAVLLHIDTAAIGYLEDAPIRPDNQTEVHCFPHPAFSMAVEMVALAFHHGDFLALEEGLLNMQIRILHDQVSWTVRLFVHALSQDEWIRAPMNVMEAEGFHIVQVATYTPTAVPPMVPQAHMGAADIFPAVVVGHSPRDTHLEEEDLQLNYLLCDVSLSDQVV